MQLPPGSRREVFLFIILADRLVFINQWYFICNYLLMMNAEPNLFILINDGIRWQEVFKGADERMINNPEFTPDPVSLRSLFVGDTVTEGKRKLLPFLWDVVAKQGLLFGDRDMNSKVNAANPYSISYSGYNEIFTGTTDIFITGNKKKYNKNINVLEWLHSKPSFKDKIAIFSSWDIFPFILNTKRNGLPINNGSENASNLYNKIKVVDKNGISHSEDTNYDMLTFVHAMNFIKLHQPRIAVIVFGEADVVAHKKRYDLYLHNAHHADMMMAELWNFVQTSEGYKNNTTFLITTDHGRGNNQKNWYEHGMFAKGSSQTWLGVLGPGIQYFQPNREQFYNKELAGLIAELVGEKFIKKSFFDKLINQKVKAQG